VTGIADHIDERGLKGVAVLFGRPGAGEGAEFVAIVVVIRKSAKLEKIPQTVAGEF